MKPSWTAAIGHIEVGGPSQHCTAVLVAPDLIATAAHCLYPGEVAAPVQSVTFTSSAESGGTLHQGQALIGIGPDPAPLKRPAALDWALIRIAPRLDLEPVPVVVVTPDQAREALQNGASFYSAGYGSGAKDKLIEHPNCEVAPPDPTGTLEGERFFSTTCIIRLGDSGGPVVLIENGKPILIGLNASFTYHPDTGQPMAIVVSARAFAQYLRPLISWVMRAEAGSPG